MKRLNNKICVFTSSRADYGLLKPVIKKINYDKELVLKLLISGTHLKKKFGNTVSEIKKDNIQYDTINFPNSLSNSNIFKTNYLKKINQYFEQVKPKAIVVLGDRVETFLIVSSAYINHIPVAHISGGEVTIGSQDDSFRHAITKLSFFHFVSNKTYYKRVMQLGEERKRIFITGNLAYENILNTKFLKKIELESYYKIKLFNKIVIITFHPMTNTKFYDAKDFEKLLKAITKFRNIQFIFTSPNIDKGHELITKKIKIFVSENKGNSLFIKSLGQRNFFSLLKISLGIIGNSSSGVIEAPLLNKPSINIGSRQNGRINYSSVINVKNSTKAISNNLTKIINLNGSVKANISNLKKHPSNIILNKLKKLLICDSYVKQFYDL